MKKGIIAVGAGVLLVFGWHLIQVRGIDAGDVEEQADMSATINPLTNLVTLTIYQAPDRGWGEEMAEGFIQMMGPGVIERAMNTEARKNFDLYAMIIPYRVSIETQPPPPEVLERIERERREAQAAEEQRQAEAEELARQEAEAEEREHRDYIERNVSLLDTRTTEGSYFGRPVPAITGTVENSGDRTLSRVEITAYFLGEDGRRIGEHTYMVVMADSMFESDPPLRPGYRKDFTYRMDHVAPSGWGGDVDLEISSIRFE